MAGTRLLTLLSFLLPLLLLLTAATLTQLVPRSPLPSSPLPIPVDLRVWLVYVPREEGGEEEVEISTPPSAFVRLLGEAVAEDLKCEAVGRRGEGPVPSPPGTGEGTLDGGGDGDGDFVDGGSVDAATNLSGYSFSCPSFDLFVLSLPRLPPSPAQNVFPVTFTVSSSSSLPGVLSLPPGADRVTSVVLPLSLTTSSSTSPGRSVPPVVITTVGHSLAPTVLGGRKREEGRRGEGRPRPSRRPEGGGSEKSSFSSSSSSSSSPSSSLHLPASSHITLRFTLIDSFPERLLSGEAGGLSWNFPEIYASSFKSLVLAAEPAVGEIAVTSEVAYYSSFSKPPVTSKYNNVSYIYSDDIVSFPLTLTKFRPPPPTVTTFVDFQVYVPPSISSPLFILPQNETYYSLPGRGGVFILNLPHESRTILNEPLTSSTLRPAMSHFANTLRTLLGLSPSPPPNTLTSPAGTIISDGTDYTTLLQVLSPRSGRGATEWELDGLARFNYLEKFEKVRRKVKALGELVERHEGMEVMPHIAEAVTSATRLLLSSNDLAAAGDVRAAASLASDALSLLNLAEADPTLVSMLFFPEEHQMAVLLPLWAPLVLPLLGGLVKEVLRMRKKKKRRREEEEEEEGRERGGRERGGKEKKE